MEGWLQTTREYTNTFSGYLMTPTPLEADQGVDFPFSSYIDIYFSSCFMLFPINITAFFEATAISFLHSLSIDQFSLQDIIFRFLSQEHAFFHLSSK